MQAMALAGQAADSCQVFLSIGTSGLVHPAASLPIRAVRQGAILVEVNTETTPLTPRAHHFLCGRAGEVLPALLKAVWG